MQMATESLRDDIMQRIQEQNRREEEAEFNAWHADLVALPSDFKRKLENGWKADIELQPLRWMDRGLTLIQSAKVTGYVQLANGVQGPPIGSFLPYPVFQSGAEIFLKGMWLCRHEDCRLLGFSSFMEPDNRKKYLDELKNSLGHNLIKIIKAIRTIRDNQVDTGSIEFLAVLEAIIRRDYFPFFEADARSSEWASARYQKRFYNDEAKQAGADSFSRYPPQRFVERIFREAEKRVDQLWGLRPALSAQQNS